MIDIDNNEFFDMFQFPGGEYGIKWTSDKALLEQWFEDSIWGLEIVARVQSGNDLLKLLTLKNALDYKNSRARLILPYFPGARQDRVSNIGDPLTVKLYADLINNAEFESVTIVDPHSDVVVALIKNVIVWPVAYILKKIVTEHNYDTILIPDAGATKRMFSYYFPDLEFNKRLNFVQCLKKRDTKTGKLSGFQVLTEHLHSRNCLIVDDIIDGGGTFVGLAEELVRVEPNIGKLGLYGTHGIFSKGIGPLLHSADNLDGVFDEIFTTDSWKRPNLYGVKVYNLEY